MLAFQRTVNGSLSSVNHTTAVIDPSATQPSFLFENPLRKDEFRIDGLSRDRLHDLQLGVLGIGGQLVLAGAAGYSVIAGGRAGFVFARDHEKEIRLAIAIGSRLLTNLDDLTSSELPFHTFHQVIIHGSRQRPVVGGP